MPDDTDAQKPDVEHLEWAIDQRAKVQHTLLALYVYVRNTPPDDAWAYQEGLLDSLISAAFALWRAVFLADHPRTDLSIRRAQEEFLATVISTNAITFADDRRNSAWSLGFYMDTASQRVWSALGLAQNHIDGFSYKETVAGYMVSFQDQSVPNTRRAWEGLHSVVRILFNALNPGAKLPVDLLQDLDGPL